MNKLKHLIAGAIALQVTVLPYTKIVTSATPSATPAPGGMTGPKADAGCPSGWIAAGTTHGVTYFYCVGKDGKLSYKEAPSGN